MEAKFTDKEYPVRSVLARKMIKGFGLIYWARVDCRVTRWVIGRALKKPGDIIPIGTPYYSDYDSAYTAWQRQ